MGIKPQTEFTTDADGDPVRGQIKKAFNLIPKEDIAYLRLIGFSSYNKMFVRPDNKAFINYFMRWSDKGMELIKYNFNLKMWVNVHDKALGLDLDELIDYLNNKGTDK